MLRSEHRWAGSANAQLQRLENTTVTTGVVTDPTPGVPVVTPGVPVVTPFASATYRAYTYEPVCYLVREQFADEFGWRVRPVRICY